MKCLVNGKFKPLEKKIAELGKEIDAIRHENEINRKENEKIRAAILAMKTRSVTFG
jgi:hypothetical protein